MRHNAFGPKWRAVEPQTFEPEQTFVTCCCGVAMRFDWPRGSETVRCFGCGSRFDRPEHFPERTPLTWTPPPPPPPKWRRWISRVKARHLTVLALSALTLALLLAGLLLGRA